MAELTKEEQVQAIYDLKVGYALGHADIAMLKSMARQLLSSVEQEPVGVINGACKPVLYGDQSALDIGTQLYAAPQLPQPAALDENGLLRCPFCGSTARVVDNRLGFYVKCNSDNCDGFAIGPRVPELQSEQEGKIIDWEALAQAAKDKWNRRAAMLQGAEPVQAVTQLKCNLSKANIGKLADVILEMNSKPRMQNQVIAEPVQGWIPCSERMPDEDGNYWGWWSESKRQGPVWFIKSELQSQFQSSEITHWMPLPAAPQQG